MTRNTLDPLQNLFADPLHQSQTLQLSPSIFITLQFDPKLYIPTLKLEFSIFTPFLVFSVRFLSLSEWTQAPLTSFKLDLQPQNHHSLQKSPYLHPWNLHHCSEFEEEDDGLSLKLWCWVAWITHALTEEDLEGQLETFHRRFQEEKKIGALNWRSGPEDPVSWRAETWSCGRRSGAA